jgi:hypothetical protein
MSDPALAILRGVTIPTNFVNLFVLKIANIEATTIPTRDINIFWIMQSLKWL